MSQDQDRKNPAPNPSLATARISLSELDKLRAATRGPLPTLAELLALLSKEYDEPVVIGVTGNFGLRKRAQPKGGFDVAGRTSGIRLTLDEATRITAITLFGDGHDSYSAWHGPLGDGINMTSTSAEVRRIHGAPGAIVTIDDVNEERYPRDGAVVAFVYVGDGVSQVRLRRGSV